MASVGQSKVGDGVAGDPLVGLGRLSTGRCARLEGGRLKEGWRLEALTYIPRKRTEWRAIPRSQRLHLALSEVRAWLWRQMSLGRLHTLKSGTRVENSTDFITEGVAEIRSIN